jgi:hypothetical protein
VGASPSLAKSEIRGMTSPKDADKNVRAPFLRSRRLEKSKVRTCSPAANCSHSQLDTGADFGQAWRGSSWLALHYEGLSNGKDPTRRPGL